MKRMILFIIVITGVFFCVLTASAQTIQDYLNEVTIPSTIYSDMMYRKYSDQETAQEKVSTDSGEMSFRQTDYTLPGVNGLDVSITRIYSTGVLLYQMKAEVVGDTITGQVSSDWSSDKFRTFYEERYDMGIGERFSFPTMEIHYDDNGNATTKYFHAENGGVFRMAAINRNDADATELIYKPYGSEVDEFEIREIKNFDSNSHYYSYNGDVGYNGQADGRAKYKLVQKDGTTMYFSGKYDSNQLTNDEGRLLAIEDRFGNRILFEYADVNYKIRGLTRKRRLLSKITDTLDRTITFEYKKDETYDVPANNNLDERFQTIVTLPNGKKIVYDKLSVFQISDTNPNRNVSAREHVYKVSIFNGTQENVKYTYSREVEPVSFKFASNYVAGTNYSTNINSIRYREYNRVKKFTYTTGRKHMYKSGHLEYRQVESEQEVANVSNEEITLSKKQYDYEGLPTGFGGLAVDFEADGDLSTYFIDSGWLITAAGSASDHSLRTKNTAKSTISMSLRITRQATLSFYKKTYGFSTNDVNSVFKIKAGSEVIYESTENQDKPWVKDYVDIPEGWYNLTFEYTRGTGDTTSYFYLDDIRIDSYSTVSVYDEMEEANPKTVTKYVTDNNHKLVQKMVVGNDHYSVDQYTYKNQNLSSITSTMSTKKEGVFSEVSKPSYQTFEYDAYGNLTKHTVNDQIEYQYTYDVDKYHAVASASVYDLTGGSPVMKQKTEYTNDSLGNAVLERKIGEGVSTAVTAYQYDYTDSTIASPKGNLIEKKVYTENNPSYNVYLVQYEYGSNYNGAYLTKETSGGKEKVYGYEISTGNLTSETVKNNSGTNGSEVTLTTQYSYDYLNRITEIKYPDQTTKSFSYSNPITDNRSISIYDRTHGIDSDIDYHKTYVYDIRGDLVQEYYGGYSMPNKIVKSYEYDCFGNLKKMTDGNGNQVTWSYDSANRPVKKEYVNPDGENDIVELDYTTSDEDIGYQKMTDVMDIASGNRFNVLLKEDHTVWAFGDNGYYQLGNTGASTMNPQQVTGLGSSITSIAAGKDWALALDNQGRVQAWGRNTEGHLGRGYLSTHGEATPAYVTGLSSKKMIAIAAGNGHSLALQDNGTVWAWGYGERGQLGNGTNLRENPTPVQVLVDGTTTPLTGVIAIACGYNTSYALTSDGFVYAWGQNTKGQIGDGSTTNANKAKKVTNDTLYDNGTKKIIKIAGGDNGIMVLREDGRIFGWGENSYAQIKYDRYGENSVITEPTSYNESTNNADIAAGAHNYYITKTDGTLLVTGKNRFFGIDRPVQHNGITEQIMEGLSQVKKVTAGCDMAMVLTQNDDFAYLFGRNDWEQEISLNWDYPFMHAVAGASDEVTDCAGTLTVTNEEGFSTKVYYDINRQIIKEEKSNSNPWMFISTKYEYDFRGNLTKIIDPNGNQTSFAYDNFGRLSQKTDALGNVTAHSYSADDKLERIDEPGGRTTAYLYNADGSVYEQRIGTASEFANQWEFTRYSYDKSGNVVKMEIGKHENNADAVVKLTNYSYNNLNQLVMAQTKLSEGVYDKIEYQYEPRGNLKYEKHYGNDSGSQRIEKSYLYDYLQNVVQVVESATYDNTLQGRKVVQYERDAVGNIIKQKVKNGGNETSENNMTTLDTTYTYDYRNRMTKMTEPVGALGSNQTKTTNFTYDKLGNLLIKTTTKSGVQITEQYEYNVLNNVTSKKIASGSDVVRELYAYDANGNIIRKYDARNEGIESYTFGSLIDDEDFDYYTDYEYDALNRRVKTIYQNDVMEYLEYDERGNVTLRAEGEGYHAENPSGSAGDRFTYDVKNNVISYIPADDASKSMIYTYDALNNKISQTDFYSNTTNYEYYGNGLLKAVHYGEITESFAYDKTGKLRREQTDKNGNTTKIYFNVFGDPYKTEYPDGTTQTTGYCVYLGLALVVNRRKKYGEDGTLGSVSYQYDRDNNIVESKKLMEIEGDTKIYSVKTMTYDELGNLLSITSSKRSETGTTIVNESMNDTVSYTYDMFQRVTKVQGPQGRETINTYDKNGNVVETKSKISNGVYSVVSYEYDGQNRMVSKSIPLNLDDVFKQNDDSTEAAAQTSYTYYKNNNIKTMTDPNGGVTSYEYNYAGKVTKSTSPTNDSTLYEYDLNGNLVKETNANGNVTTYEYDRFHNLVQKTEPGGAQTSYQYDNNGNLTKQIMPNQTDVGIVTTYDTMNRKTSVTDADQNVVQRYTYDSNGNISAVYNGSNLLCYSYEYDQNDNVVSTADFDGNTVFYQYDILDNLIKQTDANGNITSYQYNSDSTLKCINFPDGGQVDYVYDFLGRKTSETQKINANTTAVTTYQYNWAGEVKSMTDAAGTVSKYYYDRNGNVTKMTINDEVVTIYAYDASNRMTQQQTPVNDTITNYQNFTYDGVGNVLTKTITDGTSANTRGLSYTYYDSGKVYTVSENGVLMAKYYYDLNKNVTRVEQTRDTDNSDVVEYEYDHNNRVTKEKRYFEQASVIDENAEAADGKVVSQRAYSYDVYGNLTKIVEPNGAVKEYVYDRLNRLTHELFQYDESSRNKKTYQYDGAGNVTVTTEAGQRVQTQTKTAGDVTYQQKSYISEEVRTISYEYDSMNRVTKITDPLDNVTSYTYDFAGNQASVTTDLGTYTYTFDAMSRLKTVKNPYHVLISTKEYDQRGNLISETDGNNHKTEYTYNKIGKVTQVKQPEGNTIDYAYNVFGECVSMTDGEDGTSTYGYDQFGNLTTVTDPLGNSTTYDYDYAKNMIEMAEANGSVTQYEYASFNRMVSTQDDDERTKQYRYDLSGNLVKLIDESDGEISYAYDKRGNLISRQYTDGANAVTYAFDYFGNRISMTDATGASAYTYDLLGRVTQVTKDSVTQLSYTYDAAGNVLTVTDQSGNTTAYTYDKMSRLCSVTAFGAVTTYTYDNAGNRTLTSYENGAQASYTYDSNNRVSKVENKNSEQEVISRYDYTYDGNNRVLTKKIDNNSQQVESYTYDAGGRVQTYNGPNGTTEYYYDSVGNRIGMYKHNNQAMDTGYQDGQNQPIIYVDQYVSYTYSTTSRLLSQRTSMRDGDGLEVVSAEKVFTYDARGNLTKEENYVKLSEANVQSNLEEEEQAEEEEIADIEEQTEEITEETVEEGIEETTDETIEETTAEPTEEPADETAEEPAEEAAETPDQNVPAVQPEEDVSQADESIAAEPQLADVQEMEIQAYAEAGDQLDDGLEPEPSSVPESEETEEVQEPEEDLQEEPEEEGEPEPTPDFESDSAASSANMQTLSDSRSQAWSVIGNLGQLTGGTKVSEKIYTYDGYNRLTSVTSGDTTVSYQYDGDDVRTATVKGDVTTYHDYDRGYCIAQRIVNGEEQQTVTYTHGLEYISRNENNSLSYYFYNAHGDVVQTISEADETVENRYEYDIFGETTLCIEEYANPFRYSGEYTDEETGNIYLRARYYSPETGRFITRDSFAGIKEQPNTLNRYVYCGNDPVNYVDPSGHLYIHDDDSPFTKEERDKYVEGKTSLKERYPNAIWNNYGEIIGYNPNGAGYVDRSKEASSIHGGGAQAKQPIYAIDPQNLLERNVMYSGKTGYATLVFDFYVDEFRDYGWYLGDDTVSVYSTYDLTRSEARGDEIYAKLRGTDGTGPWYTDYSPVILADAMTGDLFALIAKEAYGYVQNGKAYTMEQTISPDVLERWLLVAGLRKLDLDPFETYNFDGVERTLVQILTEDMPYFAAMMGERSSISNEAVKALSKVFRAMGMSVPDHGIFDTWEMRGAVDAVMGGFYNLSETNQDFYKQLRTLIINLGTMDKEGLDSVRSALGNNAQYYAASLRQGQRNYEEAKRREAALRAEIARQQWLAAQRSAQAQGYNKQMNYGMGMNGPVAPGRPYPKYAWEPGYNAVTSSYTYNNQPIQYQVYNDVRSSWPSYYSDTSWLGFGTVHTKEDSKSLVEIPYLFKITEIGSVTTITNYPSSFYIQLGDVISDNGFSYGLQARMGVNVGAGYIEYGFIPGKSYSVGYGDTGVTVSKQINFPYTSKEITYDQTVSAYGNTQIVNSIGYSIESNDILVAGAAIAVAGIGAMGPGAAIAAGATAAIAAIIPINYEDN